MGPIWQTLASGQKGALATGRWIAWLPTDRMLGLSSEGKLRLPVDGWLGLPSEGKLGLPVDGRLWLQANRKKKKIYVYFT